MMAIRGAAFMHGFDHSISRRHNCSETAAANLNDNYRVDCRAAMLFRHDMVNKESFGTPKDYECRLQ
jgi:hypothetical protein